MGNEALSRLKIYLILSKVLPHKAALWLTIGKIKHGPVVVESGWAKERAKHD